MSVTTETSFVKSLILSPFQKIFDEDLSTKQKRIVAATGVASTVVVFAVAANCSASATIANIANVATVIFSSTLATFSLTALSLNYVCEQTQVKRFVDVKTGEGIFKKDILLMFTAKNDHNGALKSCSALSVLNSQNKYEVVCKEISSINEINETIKQMKDQKNRIRVLWISAHGHPHEISLGEETTTNDAYDISNYNHAIRDFLDPLKKGFSLLEKNATIVLSSCSTGVINEDDVPNIAQSIASLCPGRRVFAPTKPTTETLITNFEPFSVEFLYGKTTDMTACFKHFPNQQTKSKK